MFDRVFSRPWLLVALLTSVTAAIGQRALLIQEDNSPDAFFSADAAAQDTYEAMKASFGGDELVLVQLEGARVDKAKDLLAIKELGQALAALPRVKRVLSVVDNGSGAAGAELRADERPDAALLKAIRDEAEAISIYRELGVYRPPREETATRAPVPSALGVIALVVMDAPTARLELAQALHGIEARFRRRGFVPLVASLATANAAIDRETRRSLGVFMPLVVVLSLVIGLILFRSWRAVVALFLPVGATVAIGVGGLELAGETLNLVTGVMPPLILAVGFAGAIHLVAHYAACLPKEGSVADAVRRSLREKLIPTIFAFGTTALGFASLAISRVHAVRTLGLAAAGSLVVAAGMVTLGTPALLLLLRPRPSISPRRRHLFERVAKLALRRRVAVLILTFLTLLVMAIGITRITSSFDGMDLLASEAPERLAYKQLERHGIGLGNVDVWLQIPLRSRRALLKAAPKLEKLAAALRGKEKISGTLSVCDLLRVIGYRMSHRAEIPTSLAALDIGLDRRHREAIRRDLRFFWHPERGLKLTLLTLTADGPTIAARDALIHKMAARYFPGVPIAISGHFTMLLGTPGVLTRTLTESLALTVAVIALLFGAFFRSWRFMFFGMLVNLLPVGVVLATMGWFRLPIDVATAMTGSVAFGLAVDDTFHYLYHRRQSGSVLGAAKIAGQGIVATSFLIAGSFSALAMSGFNPVMRFGLLTTLAVLIALLCDALLLPALLGPKEDIKT